MPRFDKAAIVQFAHPEVEARVDVEMQSHGRWSTSGIEKVRREQQSRAQQTKEADQSTGARKDREHRVFGRDMRRCDQAAQLIEAEGDPARGVDALQRTIGLPNQCRWRSCIAAISG